MQTVWYHYKADNVPFGASLLFMNLGLETGDKATMILIPAIYKQWVLTSLIRIVTGIWMVLSTIRWVRIKAAEKVSALMGSIQAAYTFNQTWGAVASFDYLSGDKRKWR